MSVWRGLYYMAKITVVIPVYNEIKHIAQCVESVVSQSYQNIDIIIIDDGSTDGSFEICKKMAEKDTRISIIRQKNSGPFLARKVGIDKCKTEYVTFVDADDFILNDAYGDSVEPMEQYSDMICYRISRFYENGNVKEEHHIIDPGIYNRRTIEQKVYPKLIWDFERNTPGIECSMCVRIIKTDLLRKVYKKLSQEKIYYGDDALVTYTLYQMIERMDVIDKSYYMHRQRTQSVAPYIIEDEFFDKTYQVYKALQKIFSGENYNSEIQKQIEYWYMYSVNLKKMKYDDYFYARNFLFPFDKVPSGSKIILYGAGAVGKAYYKQLTKIGYCNQILWVDRNASNIISDVVKTPDCIKNEEFDYIVIAIENLNVREEVKNFLIVEKKVEAYKIVC